MHVFGDWKWFFLKSGVLFKHLCRHKQNLPHATYLIIYDVKRRCISLFCLHCAVAISTLSYLLCLYRGQLSNLVYISDEGILGAWLKKASVNDGFLEFPGWFVWHPCSKMSSVQFKTFAAVHVQDNPWTCFFTWFFFLFIMVCGLWQAHRP